MINELWYVLYVDGRYVGRTTGKTKARAFLREGGLRHLDIICDVGVQHIYDVGEMPKGKNLGIHKYWTKEKVLFAIAKFAYAKHRAPTKFDFDNDESLPNSSTVQRCFGTLSAARVAADLSPGKVGRGGKQNVTNF